MSNAKYTWSDKREVPVFSKIDRFFVSGGWLDFFSNVAINRLQRITSDHFPIMLQSGNFSWGPSPFRFENVWLSHPDFQKLVES